MVKIMNIEKFTASARSVISSAQMLAAKNNHQQLMPIHFLSSLIDSNQTVIKNLLIALNVKTIDLAPLIAEELNRIPKVEVHNGSEQVNISANALKMLEKAIALAVENRDNFVTLEKIFESLAYDKNISDKIFSKVNIDAKKIAAAILNMRKGKSADSENAEETCY